MLTTKSLVVQYPGSSQPAINGVDIKLDAGKIHGLLGRNGAGKTTLMHAIVGVQTVTSGTVEYAPELRIGWCSQKLVIDWFLGVFDNVLLGARLRGLRRGKATSVASDALEAVGLAAYSKKRPEELSGGEQQRLMIARTLAYAPDVYVLDEPFVGLDAVVKDNLMQLLRERAELGSSILVSSHELDVLDNDVHGLTLLDRGTIMFEGTQKEFISRYVPEELVIFTLANPADQQLMRKLAKYSCRADGCTLTFSTSAIDSVGEIMSIVSAYAQVVDMTISKASLNDAIRGAYANADSKMGAK